MNRIQKSYIKAKKAYQKGLKAQSWHKLPDLETNLLNAEEALANWALGCKQSKIDFSPFRSSWTKDADKLVNLALQL